MAGQEARTEEKKRDPRLPRLGIASKNDEKRFFLPIKFSLCLSDLFALSRRRHSADKRSKRDGYRATYPVHPTHLSISRCHKDRVNHRAVN